MTLISRGGGKLKGYPVIHTDANTGGPMKPVVSKAKAPKPVVAPKPYKAKVAAPKKVSTGPAGANPQTDPFALIQGMLASTDPSQIRALLDPVYQPQREAINEQIQQLQQNTAARAAQMQQIYGAWAQYVGQIPGQIQGIYDGSSRSQGFQDGMALAQGMSGPGGAVGSHLQADANIDSTMNQQQGQAWASYAAAMPNVYLLAAAQQVKQLMGDATANETKLRQDLLSLSSQEADSIVKYLEDAQAKDASLKQWAFQEKQAQDSAKATQMQNYLNYLQKQRQIDFNNKLALGKMSLAQAKASADADYKAQLLQLRRQGLIDDQTYRQAMVSLRQESNNTAKYNAATARQNANTSSARAANAQSNADRNYKLAQQRANLANKKFQQTNANAKAKVSDKIASARQAASAYARSLGQRSSGSTSTPVWIGPKGQVSTTPVKGWARSNTSTKNKAYTRPQVYNMVYRRYGAYLRNYYQQLYPGYSKQQIRSMIDHDITAAVGYGPNG